MLVGEHMALLNHPLLPPLAPLPCGVVVIGGSAGGIPALIGLLSALPADFPIPILAVQHLPAALPSILPAILGWRTKLRVKWAADGEVIAPGTVHVAPPDRHLLAAPGGRTLLSDAARIG